MFDIGSSELLLIIIVAVVIIGPKDLPRVLYKLGQLLGKGRAMTRHFRSGIDEMIRQAEMDEMEKKWAADNARIMAQTPATGVMTGDTASSSALPASPVESGHVEHDSYEVGPHSASAKPDDNGFQPFVAGPASPDASIVGPAVIGSESPSEPEPASPAPSKPSNGATA